LDAHRGDRSGIAVGVHTRAKIDGCGGVATKSTGCNYDDDTANDTMNPKDNMALANKLYSLIVHQLSTATEEMIAGGYWHPHMTAGRISGMLLEAMTEEEVFAVTCDLKELAAQMIDCCDSIYAFEHGRAF